MAATGTAKCRPPSGIGLELGRLSAALQRWVLTQGALLADGTRVKVLALRRPGVCAGCSSALEVGVRAQWDAATRTVRCLACATGEAAPGPVAQAAVPAEAPVVPSPAVSPQRGRAGASAQQEYERRSARREERVRARYPRLGGLILALAGEPAHTRVWAQGAQGERAVAAKLDDLSPEFVEVLHDRSMRRPDGRLSKANIDHIVVAATGVWVVDAKTHRGRLEVRRAGGLIRARTEKLYIAGRDKTSLLDGLARQVDALRTELHAVDADVPVRGALCFVGTELPWFGESIGDVPLVGRRALGKILKRDGDITAEERTAVAAYLADRFPATP